jgi:hypothetical protein
MRELTLNRALLAFQGAYLLTAQEASAISVELAIKCRALAIRAHPAPKVGTKATGARHRWDDDKDCVLTHFFMEMNFPP